MKKLLIITLLLIGCSFLTGEKKDNPKPGEEKYGEAPIVTLGEAIGGILGIGALGGAAARIARNAARARDGMMDANEEALDKADWTKINTKESVKELLNLAQKSHDDSKLLAKTYKNWKKKKV